MNLKEIKGITTMNSGIQMDDLRKFEQGLRYELPQMMRDVWLSGNGFQLRNGVTIYSTEEFIERNDTFEVQKYAPGFIAVGDDSGGRAIMVPLRTSGIFLVDHGSMDPDDMEEIGSSIIDWIDRDCPI